MVGEYLEAVGRGFVWIIVLGTIAAVLILIGAPRDPRP